jgi:hypothetical protein
MNRDIRAICAGDAIDRMLIEPGANGARQVFNVMVVSPE